MIIYNTDPNTEEKNIDRDFMDLIKKRAGIAKSASVYDDDVESYIKDCLLDMKDSGVPEKTIESGDDRVVTATTLYVKAYIGNDRSDTEKYMKLYRDKVSRLTLDEEEETWETEA